LVKTLNIGSEYPNVQYGYVDPTKETTSSNNISSSVTFNGTPKSVTFFPDGTSNKAGSVYLILTKDLAAGNRDRMRAITVIKTGRIKFWRYKASLNPPWE